MFVCFHAYINEMQGSRSKTKLHNSLLMVTKDEVFIVFTFTKILY
jgi:hypothetical protein